MPRKQRNVVGDDALSEFTPENYLQALNDGTVLGFWSRLHTLIMDFELTDEQIADLPVLKLSFVPGDFISTKSLQEIINFWNTNFYMIQVITSALAVKSGNSNSKLNVAVTAMHYFKNVFDALVSNLTVGQKLLSGFRDGFAMKLETHQIGFYDA